MALHGIHCSSAGGSQTALHYCGRIGGELPVFGEGSVQGRHQRILNTGAEGVLDQWQGELGN